MDYKLYAKIVVPQVYALKNQASLAAYRSVVVVVVVAYFILSKLLNLAFQLI